MATSSNLSLTESSVYRSIYNGLGNTCYLSATGQPVSEDHVGLVDTNKWTFVQKLIAIEEAHDRRGLESRRLIHDRGDYAHKHDRSETTVESSTLPDVLSRWLNHQVLDDNPDRPPSLDESNRSQNRLPALNKGQQLSNDLSIVEKQIGSSLSSPIFQIPADDVPFSAQTGFEMEETNQMTFANDRAQSPSAISWCTQDGDISVIKPNRKRPLRLPPILLPRLYTISPRPMRCRQFLTPTKIRGPITDQEWEDLKDCRYIRHAAPELDLQVVTSDVS